MVFAPESRRYEKEEESNSSYRELKKFILENYPRDGERIVREALDGFETIEEHDKKGNLIGIITYDMGTDKREESNYCVIGVILVEEERRGEGIAKELFKKLRNKCDLKCDYYTAKADTNDGRKLIEELGFDYDGSVDGKSCYKLEV